MTDLSVAEFRDVFRRAPFIHDLGVELEAIAKGECATSLAVQPRFLQVNGYVHAGVQATLADHTMGAAAFTLVSPGQYVVTVEFKMSMLRSAQGETLRCRANVLKPGKQFIFVEAEVYCASQGKEQLTLKASATMAVIGGTM